MVRFKQWLLLQAGTVIAGMCEYHRLPPAVFPFARVCTAAVTLVGYDTTSEPPFWILKNSWVS